MTKDDRPPPRVLVLDTEFWLRGRAGTVPAAECAGERARHQDEPDERTGFPSWPRGSPNWASTSACGTTTTSEPESTGNPGTAGRGFGGDASAGVTVAASRASGRTDRIRTAHLPALEALEALEADGQAGRGTYARPWAPGSPSLAMSSRAKRSRVSRSTMSTVEETTQDT